MSKYKIIYHQKPTSHSDKAMMAYIAQAVDAADVLSYPIIIVQNEVDRRNKMDRQGFQNQSFYRYERDWDTIIVRLDGIHDTVTIKFEDDTKTQIVRQFKSFDDAAEAFISFISIDEVKAAKIQKAYNQFNEEHLKGIT